MALCRHRCFQELLRKEPRYSYFGRFGSGRLGCTEERAAKDLETKAMAKAGAASRLLQGLHVAVWFDMHWPYKGLTISQFRGLCIYRKTTWSLWGCRCASCVVRESVGRCSKLVEVSSFALSWRARGLMSHEVFEATVHLPQGLLQMLTFGRGCPARGRVHKLGHGTEASP